MKVLAPEFALTQSWMLHSCSGWTSLWRISFLSFHSLPATLSKMPHCTILAYISCVYLQFLWCTRAKYLSLKIRLPLKVPCVPMYWQDVPDKTQTCNCSSFCFLHKARMGSWWVSKGPWRANISERLASFWTSVFHGESPNSWLSHLSSLPLF